MIRRSRSGALGAALVLVLWGCGAAATPIPATSAGAASTAPSVAASEGASASDVASVAAPSVEPSAAESVAEPSTGGASFAIPSLPSDAKDLEALLPSTLCGQTATKTSISGANLGQSVDAQFLATLQALGKSVNDVTFAVAFATSGCGAGIFRIQGVDQNALQSALVAEEQKSGSTVSQATVGGKSVFISSDASSSAGKQYVYFHGDAVIFAQAPDEAKAASILQALP